MSQDKMRAELIKVIERVRWSKAKDILAGKPIFLNASHDLANAIIKAGWVKKENN